MRTIRQVAACLILGFHGSLCESGDTDFGPLADFIEPPIILPTSPTVDDLVRVRIAFGNCVVIGPMEDPNDISVEGNVVTVILNRFTNADPNCGSAGTRSEGDIEIGMLPQGEYRFDLLGRRSTGSISNLYTGIEFGVSAPVAIPTLQREITITLSLLLMVAGARRLTARN